MKLVNDADLKQIARDRDDLEVELAIALNSQFKHDALQEVRTLCGDLVRKIQRRASPDKWLLVVENNDLRIWKTRYPPPPCSPRQVDDALWRLLGNYFNWSPEDCSDIIRLYGEIVEKDPRFKNENLLKNTFRGSKIITVDVPDSMGTKKIEKILKHGQKPETIKVREVKVEIKENVAFETGGTTHSGQKVAFRDRERITEDPSRYVPLLVTQNYPNQFRGITTTRLAEHDTVRKIDQMFALPEGCSISGTTADSIFSVDVATSRTLTGWLQLLPIATMVGQYHHTVLECGLTLTLNKKVAYKIGFYKSLSPLSGSIPPEVAKVLSDFEETAIGKGLVAFAWTKNNVRRGIVLESGDAEALQRFRSLAEVTDEHMRVWRTMGSANTAGPAWELWMKHVGKLGGDAGKLLEDSLFKDGEKHYGSKQLPKKVDIGSTRGVPDWAKQEYRAAHTPKH